MDFLCLPKHFNNEEERRGDVGIRREGDVGMEGWGDGTVG